jgi:hypothetical protein
MSSHRCTRKAQSRTRSSTACDRLRTDAIVDGPAPSVAGVPDGASLLLVVPILAYVLLLHVGTFVMCRLKGKFGLGILAFLVPVFGTYPASSLARAESWWARHRYGPDKIASSEQRPVEVDLKPLPNPQDSVP